MVGTAGGVPWRVTSGNHSSQSTGSGTPAVGWGGRALAEETQKLRPQLFPPSPFDRPIAGRAAGDSQRAATAQSQLCTVIINSPARAIGPQAISVGAAYHYTRTPCGEIRADSA